VRREERGADGDDGGEDCVGVKKREGEGKGETVRKERKKGCDTPLD
jgi:hypothetical protein